MLVADEKNCSLIMSLKEGNIFHLKQEYIVLKIEMGNLSDWIII